MNEEQVKQIIREELKGFILIDKYTFQKHIQLFNGRNIQLGKGIGTEIGTETSQKIGFYGTTPVVQPSDVGSLTETGVDEDGVARAKVNDIRDLLQDLGLMA